MLSSTVYLYHQSLESEDLKQKSTLKDSHDSDNNRKLVLNPFSALALQMCISIFLN